MHNALTYSEISLDFLLLIRYSYISCKFVLNYFNISYIYKLIVIIIKKKSCAFLPYYLIKILFS